MTVKIAMDESQRRYDGNGHLIIDRTIITKAAVNDYMGKEIPKHEELGLDPNKIYRLLRDPEELKKALFSFQGIQFLIRHIPVHADEPQKDSTVGSIGTDVEMEGDDVYSSMRVWDQKAIDYIESKKMQELSAGYAYTADMTPGEWKGQPYDGVMRNIHGNHVALVKHGRIGSDAVIADHLPIELVEIQMSGKTRLKKGAVGRIAAVLKGMAMDADLGQDEMEKVVNAVADEMEDDPKPAKDEDEPKKAEDEEKEPTKDEDEPTKAKDEDPKLKPAMDAALITANAKTEARQEMMALFNAREVVKPLVGVIAMDGALDSAEAVYEYALNEKGINTKGIHPSAYQSMVGLLIQSNQQQNARPTMALDSNAVAETQKLVGRFG
nr:DUF2213 domain-containing protein [Acinetobacter sp. Marseille-Q1620]